MVEAASLGDGAAEVILEQAGAELALLVDATRGQLGFAVDEVVDVSHSGGVFGATAVRQAFGSALAGRGAYRLCEPEFPPVIGARRCYAACRSGQPFRTRRWLDCARVDRYVLGGVAA